MSQVQFPAEVEEFVKDLYEQVVDNNVKRIESLYARDFYKLSEERFAKSKWPQPDDIALLVEGDELFVKLYKELYYRHIYSRLAPTISDRFESWQNYCDLFHEFLDTDFPVSIHLPKNWLWDIIDEFVYQFQNFHHFRVRGRKSEDEAQLLADFPSVWRATEVVHFLEHFVSKSNIVHSLNESKSVDLSQDHFANNPTYAALGYFSLIALLRVHTLLGDFSRALTMVDAVDLSKQGMYTQVLPCHITVAYYVGFCYLMNRRYVDAGRTFEGILGVLVRNKNATTYQYEQTMKKYEQICSLLVLVLSLYPLQLGDAIHSVIKENYGEKLALIQGGAEEVVTELFSYSCPKFITVVDPENPPPPSEGKRPSAFEQQLKAFVQTAKEQFFFLNLRSYLKIFTSISVPKLAALIGMTEPDLRENLDALKNKQTMLVWKGGPASSGVQQSVLDVDFRIEGDMVHIREEEKVPNLAPVFLDRIGQLTSL